MHPLNRREALGAALTGLLPCFTKPEPHHPPHQSVDPLELVAALTVYGRSLDHFDAYVRDHGCSWCAVCDELRGSEFLLRMVPNAIESELAHSFPTHPVEQPDIVAALLDFVHGLDALDAVACDHDPESCGQSIDCPLCRTCEVFHGSHVMLRSFAEGLASGLENYPVRLEAAFDQLRENMRRRRVSP
jgi:hypothetical protein